MSALHYAHGRTVTACWTCTTTQRVRQAVKRAAWCCMRRCCLTCRRHLRPRFEIVPSWRAMAACPQSHAAWSRSRGGRWSASVGHHARFAAVQRAWCGLQQCHRWPDTSGAPRTLSSEAASACHTLPKPGNTSERKHSHPCTPGGTLIVALLRCAHQVTTRVPVATDASFLAAAAPRRRQHPRAST